MSAKKEELFGNTGVMFDFEPIDDLSPKNNDSKLDQEIEQASLDSLWQFKRQQSLAKSNVNKPVPKSQQEQKFLSEKLSLLDEQDSQRIQEVRRYMHLVRKNPAYKQYLFDHDLTEDQFDHQLVTEYVMNKKKLPSIYKDERMKLFLQTTLTAMNEARELEDASLALIVQNGYDKEHQAQVQKNAGNHSSVNDFERFSENDIQTAIRYSLL